MKGDNPKVLAYFASDVESGNWPEFLESWHKRGYTLLALDTKAMAMASRIALPFTLLEDWLAPGMRLQALEDALDSAMHWYEAARDYFCVDEVCLPERDFVTMKWFWQDAMLAVQLARTLRDSSCSSFCFFGNFFRRASVQHLRSDIHASLWEAEMPGVAFRLSPLGSWKAVQLKSMTRKVLSRIRQHGDKAANSVGINRKPLQSGSLVVVMGPGEEHRFAEIVAQLSLRFPGETAVVIGASYSEHLQQTVDRYHVPIRFGARWPAASFLRAFPDLLLPTVDHRLAQQFLAGYYKAQQSSRGHLWEKPLVNLGYHFKYYCKYRWPFLCKVIYGFWLDLWRSLCPRAVVLTSRPESPISLAADAAQRIGIPTFVLPHAGVANVGKPDGKISGDYLLCNSRHQQRIFHRTGVSMGRDIVCRDLLAISEYPVQPVEAFVSRGKVRLLALTEATAEGITLIKYTDPGSQLSALKILAEPPPDLREKLELAIKPHPLVPEFEMFELVEPSIREKIMRTSSDLQAALCEADLVIAVNYRGTAMMHALRQGKPLVYLLTDPEELMNRPDHPYDLFSDGTTVARNSAEFWGIIRSFLHDPSIARAMVKKSLSFAGDWLDDTGLPLFSDVIHDILIAGETRPNSSPLCENPSPENAHTYDLANCSCQRHPVK